MGSEKQEELTPMNIYEAIEVMKILRHFKPRIEAEAAKSLLDIIAIITSQAKEEDTGILLFRMVALMYHKDVNEVFAEMQDKSGIDFIAHLSQGLQVNNVEVLLDSAGLLGL
jgi:hypothetical protein